MIIPHLEQAIASTCKKYKAKRVVKSITLAVTEPRNKEKKGSDCLKKEVHWLKKMAQNYEEKQRRREREGGEKQTRKGEKERQTCLSLPSLWYDKFMHSSCVCQSRPGVFVGLFLREEGGKKRGREKKVRKRGERES